MESSSKLNLLGKDASAGQSRSSLLRAPQSRRNFGRHGARYHWSTKVLSVIQPDKPSLSKEYSSIKPTQKPMFLRRRPNNNDRMRDNAVCAPKRPSRSPFSPSENLDAGSRSIPQSEPKTLTRLPSKRKLIKRKSSRTLLKNQQVRFSIDDDGEVTATVHLYKRPSPRHLPNLYFSEREKAEIQFLARCEGETFLFEEEELVEQLEKCFASCGRDDCSFDDDPTNRPGLEAWVANGTRGLEDTVSEEFEDRRTQAVTMVLEYQNYLRETLGRETDCDELLRAYCEKISRATREFCQRMGCADETFVRSLEEEELSEF